MPTPVTRTWPGFRRRTFITCVSGGHTGSGGWCLRRPGPRLCRSASGGNPNREENRATSGWIRCIRGIGTKGGLSHQCRRRGYPVAGGRGGGAHPEAWLQPRRREAVRLGFHTETAGVIIRIGVDAEQAQCGADQVTARTFQRQRAGGDQKRRSGQKAHGLRPHRVGYADSINDFYVEHFNPYLNFHRPCGSNRLSPSQTSYGQRPRCLVRATQEGTYGQPQFRIWRRR